MAIRLVGRGSLSRKTIALRGSKVFIQTSHSMAQIRNRILECAKELGTCHSLCGRNTKLRTSESPPIRLRNGSLFCNLLPLAMLLSRLALFGDQSVTCSRLRSPSSPSVEPSIKDFHKEWGGGFGPKPDVVQGGPSGRGKPPVELNWRCSAILPGQ